jgi:integrase
MGAKTTTAATTKPPQVKLTRHSKGWVAKIGGKVRWLAPLDRPELALERYHQKRAAHDAGRVLRPAVDANVTIGTVARLFIERKWQAHQAGEIGVRTFNEYRGAAKAFADVMGVNRPVADLRPLDFGAYRTSLVAKAKADPHTLRRLIVETRAMFRWAERNQVIDRPVAFGDSFDPPPASVFRKAKRDAGERLFTAAQVKAIRAKMKGDAPWDAMFLLALNGGFGNTDIANLPREAVDLRNGVIDYSRPKTDVDRLVPLWPETVAALRKAIAARPEAKSDADAGLVFLSKRGHRLVRYHVDATTQRMSSFTDRVSVEFGQFAKAAKVSRSFYDARRTFQTVGDEIGPEHVVRHIMGHAERRDDMGAVYRQRIEFARLKAVTDHVRSRLLTPASRASTPKARRGKARAKRAAH